jgi:hypothetical protein
MTYETISSYYGPTGGNSWVRTHLRRPGEEKTLCGRKPSWRWSPPAKWTYEAPEPDEAHGDCARCARKAGLQAGDRIYPGIGNG